MQQFIDSYIATLSGQFFINQVITILLLVIYGVVFVGIIRGKSLSIADYILAYPLYAIRNIANGITESTSEPRQPMSNQA